MQCPYVFELGIIMLLAPPARHDVRRELWAASGGMREGDTLSIPISYDNDGLLGDYRYSARRIGFVALVMDWEAVLPNPYEC